MHQVFNWRAVTTLAAHDARDEQPVERGHIYTPPPDRHLLLSRRLASLSRSAISARLRSVMS